MPEHYDRTFEPPPGTIFTPEQARELATQIEGDERQQTVGSGRDVVYVGNGETAVLVATLRAFAEMAENPPYIEQHLARYEKTYGHQPLDAGKVWTDRAIRATGNTTRLCRAAVATAVSNPDIHCFIVVSILAHAQYIKDMVDGVWYEKTGLSDPNDSVIFEGRRLPANFIKDRIHVVTYDKLDAAVASRRAVAIFPDGSIVPEIVRKHFAKFAR